MSRFQVDLLQKKISGGAKAWEKRLNLVLVVFFVVYFLAGGVLAFNYYLLNKEAEQLSSRRSQLEEDVEKKKNVEGLYLTLKSRLEIISNIKSKSSSVHSLVEGLYSFLEEGVDIKALEIADGGIKLEIASSSPQGIDNYLEKLQGENSIGVKFSNLTAEKTDISKDGFYTVSVSSLYKKNQTD